MNLKALGWRPRFERQLALYPGCLPARVCCSHRDHFELLSAAGLRRAQVAGKLRLPGSLFPITGDWIALRNDEVIEAVLERETVLARKQPGKTTDSQILAANIDVLFVVTALDHDFNLRRLERYLLLANEAGIRPVILLNKADLDSDPAVRVADARSVASGFPVLTLSAKEGWGLEALDNFCLPGETAALAGSSGVGKSTIVNRLLGVDLLATQPVRAHDSRGVHTTTRRELFLLPQGWLLMDLPGIRELQPLADSAAVSAVFDDIATAAASCRYRDCSHTSEPGCAVRATIPESRLLAYRKLLAESAHERRQTDPEAARALKQRWKAIHKAMRRNPKPYR